MSDRQAHALFQRFPLTGTRAISTGEVPVPYHVYDGHGLLLGGTVSATAAAHLMAEEGVKPVLTQAGQALMAIWVCDFTAASLGPHTELQFALLASNQPVAPLPDHPLSLLKALAEIPGVGLFAHGLWNNAASAVAYNRELLGLRAHAAHSTITRAPARETFVFRDESDALIFRGEVTLATRTPPGVAWQMLQLFGIRGSVRLSRQPYLAATVINPVGDVLPTNAQAKAYVAADTPIVQRWDAATDRLEFGRELYRSLQFQPTFVEQFEPFRFVYLMPEEDPGAAAAPDA